MRTMKYDMVQMVDPRLPCICWLERAVRAQAEGPDDGGHTKSVKWEILNHRFEGNPSTAARKCDFHDAKGQAFSEKGFPWISPRAGCLLPF